MKISVVMATYNGEKYIISQMDSIREQIRKPDEVIFCDDGSKDATIDIIGNYISEHGLQEWKIISGNHSGITGNFYRGVDNAIGDIVFFSDQDDIWSRDKIQKMMKPFENSEVLTVTCRKNLINENGQAIKNYPAFMHYPKIKRSMGRFLTISDELKYLTCSGLCLAFRKTIFDEVKSFVMKNNLEYDLAFGLVSSVKKGNYSINDYLVKHRIHTNNASAPITSVSGRVGKRLHQMESHEKKKIMLSAVYEKYGSELGENICNTIKSAIKLHEKYIVALRNNNRVQIIMLLLCHNKLLNKYVCFADLLSTLKAPCR